MPTIRTMELPRPTDPLEFESITMDAMKLAWSTPRLDKNGRPGQAQNGVDIWGWDDLERPVGIQCKRTVDVPSIATIRKEVEAAEKFSHSIRTLWIATTADPDASLQQRVRQLSADRAATGDFAVGLLFWESIVAGLTLNADRVRSHYPQLNLDPLAHVRLPERLAWAFELGHFGGHIKGWIDLIGDEVGAWVAGEDPDQILAICDLVKLTAERLLPATGASPIVASAEGIHREVSPLVAGKLLKAGAPDRIAVAARRVEQRVSNLGALLVPAEAQALRLGSMTGAAYLSLDDPTEHFLDSLITTAEPLLSEAGLERLRARLEPARSALGSGGHVSLRWSHGLRGIIAHDLRSQAL